MAAATPDVTSMCGDIQNRKKEFFIRKINCFKVRLPISLIGQICMPTPKSITAKGSGNHLAFIAGAQGRYHYLRAYLFLPYACTNWELCVLEMAVK